MTTRRARLLTCMLLTLLLLAPTAYAQITNNSDTAGDYAAQGTDPPYQNVFFLDPDIIVETDPSALVSVTYKGQEPRFIKDERIGEFGEFVTLDTYLFDVTYEEGLVTEFVANPEFGSPEAAQAEVEKYAFIMGQLPYPLRTNLKTIWMHKGMKLFEVTTTINDDPVIYAIEIYTDQGDSYAQQGFLEEILVNKATRRSLNDPLALSQLWHDAQAADGQYISTFAHNFSNVSPISIAYAEDMPESFLAYLAVEYRSDRISQEMYDTIVATIPNRLDFFRLQPLFLYPITETPLKTPPFESAIDIDPDIITSSDPTAFKEITYDGRGVRFVVDQRVRAQEWGNRQMEIFTATYENDLTVEFVVSLEFGSPTAAQAEAEKYATLVGQLPYSIRADLSTIWIHRGTEAMAGISDHSGVVIHTGQADFYAQDGTLEEALVHAVVESAFSLDHIGTQGYADAVQADGGFFSTVASDAPSTDDVPESFLAYLAAQHRSDRISQETYETIRETIPNRIAYFNSQSLDISPLESTSLSVERVGDDVPAAFTLTQNYPNPFNPTTTIAFELSQPGNVRLQVFNLLGKEVAVLAAGAFPGGRFEAKWNATGFPSGVYVYRLETDSYSQTRSMLLLK